MSAPHPRLSLAVLSNLLADILLLDPDEVAPDALLVDDLGVQSIDLVELAERVEDELGAPWSPLDLDDVETVADLHGAVSRVLHARSAA